MADISGIISELNQCPTSLTKEESLHWMFMVLSEIIEDEAGAETLKSHCLASIARLQLNSDHSYMGVSITRDENTYRATSSGLELITFKNSFDITSNDLNVLKHEIELKLR